MHVEKAEREFRYNGVKLKDPNPAQSLEQVREFYAHLYPEITSAAIEGPENVGNKLVYEFRKAVGTKGGEADPWQPIIAAFLAERENENVFFRDVYAACVPDAGEGRATSAEIDRIRSAMIALGWHKFRTPWPRRNWYWKKAEPAPFPIPDCFRDKPIVIYGPPATGKSRNVRHFAQLFGRATIVDGWNGDAPLPADAIATTNLSTAEIARVQAAYLVSIDDARSYARRRGMF